MRAPKFIMAWGALHKTSKVLKRDPDISQSPLSDAQPCLFRFIGEMQAEN